jgi:uncharacterized protein YhfF
MRHQTYTDRGVRVIIPAAIRSFWEAFQATVEFDALPRFYEAFHFDDNERTANKLARLVILGTKRATASLLWSFEARNKPPPKPGDLSVVTNWQTDPLCIIETRMVTIVPFEAVTESFAAAEGEGDKSLRYWRKAHWSYFSRECQRLGKEPSCRMPVVCERFEVIYPLG